MNKYTVYYLHIYIYIVDFSRGFDTLRPQVFGHLRLQQKSLDEAKVTGKDGGLCQNTGYYVIL